MHFRQVHIEDLEELQKISKRSFIDAYAHLNTASNMDAYVSKAFSLEQLSHELNSPDSTFYFAYIDNQLVAYLKLNCTTLDVEHASKKAFEIQRIYVLEAFQGQGIGSQLIAKSIELAKERSLDYIWLGVWSKNKQAFKFYQRMGFKKFDEYVFQFGDEAQIDFLMKLKL